MSEAYPTIRARGVLFALTILLALGSQAMAENTWCSGFTGYIFCYDFDRNCVSPPPAPQVCPSCPNQHTRNDGPIGNVWQYNSWNVNTQHTCGSDMCGEEIMELLPSHPYGGRHANGGDEGGNLGQNTVDLSPYVQNLDQTCTTTNGSDARPLVLTFTMGSYARGAMQFNNGYMELSLGDQDQWNPVTSTAKAPTDFVLVGAASGTCTNCSASCTGGAGSLSMLAWPSICQQEFPNPLCPPKQTFVHTALAVGALAFLDNNPCHCCTQMPIDNPNQRWRRRCVPAERTSDLPDGWQEPTNVHLSYFDGIEWHVLRQGAGGPGGYGDFRYGNYILCDQCTGLPVQQCSNHNTDSGYELVELTVKTSTVNIKHTTKMVNLVDGQWVETMVDSMAYDMPRRYTGAFNRLRAGTDENCQLVEQGDANYDGTYKCDPGYANGHRKCQVMKEEMCDATGGNATLRCSYVSFDNAKLDGGTCGVVIGSCCLGDTTCVETDVYTCETVMGGHYQGDGRSCLATACCPYPFADADHDGDVDQEDFGAFQICYTGSTGGVPAGCSCFDRNKDGNVNDLDFTAFANCFTEANVKWAQALTPSCTP